MSTSEQVWASAAEHVEAYRRTGGVQGYWWHGRPHLLLGTTGRRTGQVRTVPLVVSRLEAAAGPCLVVVASAGGAERHPAWYLNLVADPGVTVQLHDQVWSARARTATGADEQAAWEAVRGTWEGFETYRRGTARRIPLVLLSPDSPDGSGRPGEPAEGPGGAGPDALP